MKKGILFDLDGTLWDAVNGVTMSWNRAMERLGRQERFTEGQIRSLMGKTMDAIARECFPEEDPAKAAAALNACVEEENGYLRDFGGNLFDGLEDTLLELKKQGCFLAVVSNCQEGYIEAFLAHHHLEPLFGDFESFGHTGRGKGFNIRQVVRRNHLDSALYVGDTEGDREAALEAGVPFLHAAYGFGTVPEGTPSVSDIRLLPGKAEETFRAERIARYEEMMEQAERAAEEMENALENYGRTGPLRAALEAYLASPEWKEDYEADEAGKLPVSLKRGVLSQDGLYNLLDRFAELDRRLGERSGE